MILAIATGITVLSITTFAQPPSALDSLEPQIHKLPQSLKKWQNKTDTSDYLSQVEPTPLGYLIWSNFPVKVYVQQPQELSNSAADMRYQQWINAVKKAIAEWNIYLPLKEVTKPEQADIVILRSQPEREAKLNPDTGLYDIPRAVTAETTYEFYLKQTPPTIAHKMTVAISPNYAGISLLATARHELGHALGIWGHSNHEEDALYFSQVSNPPGISARDINTLKKVYQQPTKLGWNF